MLVSTIAFAQEGSSTQPNTGSLLEAVPDGYMLQAYDDCGILERQPHVDMTDSYCWTFATSDTDADLKSRSALFSYKSINLSYPEIDPELSYVLAVTYASDHVYKRVQSLWANGVQLHEPYALPNAKAVRLVVKVPRGVVQSGKMALQIRIHGEVNATVSIVELWADAPPKQNTLTLASVSGLGSDLTGRVLGLDYEPVAGAAVRLQRSAEPTVEPAPLATVKTTEDGWFRFPRSLFENAQPATDLQVVAHHQGQSAIQRVPAADLVFTPVRYRPIAAQVTGLAGARQLLDGTWRINPAPTDDVRARPLVDESWQDYRVPGQWRQQGFDVAQDQTVAVAHEFVVPPAWDGYRVFIRFDAIHAGTHYWLNGQSLGYSENLFTPVEWDITALVNPGKTNRLDLAMKVDTVSEQLSYSSGYAFHNLGGIDRSVRIFALPPVHVSAMHFSTQLDEAYRDAELRFDVTLENAGATANSGLSLELLLTAPDGKSVSLSAPRLALDTLEPGTNSATVVTHIENPLKWSAEKPHLYRLVLQLKRDGELLESIERNIGFREIEVRGSELLINGVSVKFAGACRHETDPLSGRANTMQSADRDVALIKGANLNYIRTCHYPPTMELVDAADRQGMYLEVEAPFCWVGVQEGPQHVREVLVPTSAMVDYYHTHPSVIVWSLANESHFNRSFEISHDLVKQLDPTRATTFNNPDPKRICDIANLHYPPMPYDELVKDDPRPLFLGEYFFPVCHEQTDVRINPGLREYFGFGHSQPDSPFARQAAESFQKPFLKPGTAPGAWTHILESKRVLGGAIWAAFDEPFYFSDGTHAGYAWHHGFWGIIDGWRRPKPEWWLTKCVFAPVWFPQRQVEYVPGQEVIHLPIENRYAFTDLKELTFSWQLGTSKGDLNISLSPRSQGVTDIPLPPGAASGQKLLVTAKDAQGQVVNVATIQLGTREPRHVPEPSAGPPALQRDGDMVTIEGQGFALVFDAVRGDFNSSDPQHRAAVTRFPVPHMTQYDFGDLAGARGKPYAVYPDASTRVIEQVSVKELAHGLELSVCDHYDLFAGTTRWVIDKRGVGKVSWHYVYSGEELDTREAGVRFVLDAACSELSWQRWSEWDVFPSDSISRTVGQAQSLRGDTPGTDAEGVRPTWPWSQDQTERGTADFRSIKFNIYQAALDGPDGNGLRVHASADRHVRACLDEGAVLLHVLSRCELGQIVINKGDELIGECTVELVGPPR